MVVWWQGKGGIGPPTMTPPYQSHWYVKWRGGTTFEYGRVSSVDAPALGAPTPKVLTYVPSGSASGTVNGNDVTINVPLASLGGLTAGDKIDHVIAYSLVEHGSTTLNDWADQAKSFSYVIGTPAAAQHQADGYVEVSTDPNFTSSTRAVLNPADNTWTAALTGTPIAGTVFARQILAKDLYTPLWDNVQAGPVAEYLYNFGADLKVTKSADQTTAHLGQPVTFTVTVTDVGPLAAQGLTLTETFSKNAGYVSVAVTKGAWSCNAKPAKATVTCTLSSLAANDYGVVKIVLKPTAKGTLTNTATVNATSPGDPNTTNNTATVSIPVTP